MVSCLQGTGAFKCRLDEKCPHIESCTERSAQDRLHFDKPLEGVELPLFVPTESLSLYIQQVGRAYRELFAIISTPEGFKFGEWHISNGWMIDGKIWSWLRDSKTIVATYQNSVHCKQQLAKAQALEKQLRPMWQAALEHAKRLENIMLDQVYAVARDNEIK